MAEGDTNKLSLRNAHLLGQLIAIHSQDTDREIIDSLKGIVADPTAAFVERIGRKCREFAGRSGTPHTLKGHLETIASMDQASRVELATLLMLADIRPDPAYGLKTDDQPFMRIMVSICNSGPVGVDKLIQDDLTRLIAIRRYFPTFLPRLVDLAEGGRWAEQMGAVERRLGPSGAGDGDGETLSPAAEKLLAEIANASEKPEMHPLTLLQSDPLLSAVLPGEVIAFAQLDSIPIDDRVEDFRPIADSILKSEHGQAFRDGEIRAALGLRIGVAEYFRQLRLTAKFDVLESRWRRLLRMLQTNLAMVKRLEKHLLENQQGDLPSAPDDVPKDLWEECRNDQFLRKLFQARPHFDELTLEELARYLKVSKIATKTAGQEAGGSEAVPPGDRPVVRIPDYQPLEIVVKGTGTEGHYSVSLAGPPSDPSVATGTVRIDWSAVDRNLLALGRVRQDSPVAAATRDLSAPAPELEPTLVDIGKLIYNWFFLDAVKERFDAVVGSPKDYRIYLRLNDAPLARIPWESLYLPKHQTSVALIPQYSIIRCYESTSPRPPRSFKPPLRILVVLPMPVDVTRLESEQEAASLERTLAADVQGGRVELKFLRNEEARIDEFQRAIRVFDPHIFHFAGHGYFDPAENKGYLVFQKDGRRDSYDPGAMATLLLGTNVGIAVLNGCDTGTTYSNDGLGGVAGALVTAGVPAVIATMRQVVDDAALLFTREFYRSFVDGSPVEVAVVEARNALRKKKYNWSAYALFSGGRRDVGPEVNPDEDLRALRLMRERAAMPSVGRVNRDARDR